MSKRILLMFILLSVIVFSTGVVGEQLNLQTIPVSSSETIMQPMYRAGCTMAKTNLTFRSFFGSFAPGMGNYTYFDPAVECAATPTYPYAITDFSFALTSAGGTFPVTLDVVVYDIVPGADKCAGPGAELCRFQIIADAASFDEVMGTATFPSPCCVNRPFFIGLEYVSGAAAPPASITYDDVVSDTCDNWFLYQGIFYEWSDIWSPPPPGYPLFVVGGETDAEALCGGTADCPTWLPGDTFKTVNLPQLPDEAGWDVNATYPKVLADDFMCGETGYIKDIHFWGSWRHEDVGQVRSFILSFHSDIPADQSQYGYSMPGELLWEREITVFTETMIQGADREGWYDPYTGEVYPNDHVLYMQYDVCLDEADWFPQDSGVIYWLNISAIINEIDYQGTQWGWKSTQWHWNDDAVFLPDAASGWQEMYEPGSQLEADTITNAFYVEVDPQGMLIGGGGEDAYGEGWYYYPWYDWWNIWFYDHPYDPERYKTIKIEFDAFPLDPSGAPMFLELAVNWSTDQWSLDQPLADSSPPLPGVDEDLYIGRTTLFASDYVEGHYVVEYTIPDYNPEWVSIDVRGFNFVIPMGIITHACTGEAQGQSLDLSFVITGDPEGGEPIGACCLPDGSCVDTNSQDCNQQGGTYMGDGTDCASTTCNNPPVAICQNVQVFNDMGLCSSLLASIDNGSYDPDSDPITLTQIPAGPYPVGLTSNVMLVVTDPFGLSDTCYGDVIVIDIEPPVVVCPNDTVITVASGLTGANVSFTISATDNCPGVTVAAVPPSGSFFPIGVTTVLVTATDASGLIDTCYFKVTVRTDGTVDCPFWIPGDSFKTVNLPQLPDESGWDVNATYPAVLADDFKCSETGYIKDIHFWGSWLDGVAGQVDTFVIAFYSDIPAVQSPYGYSMPGELLWEMHIVDYTSTEIDAHTMEGWYDPFSGGVQVLPDNHRQYFQYDICLEQALWFPQDSGRIYWLKISAKVAPTPGIPAQMWGWKSSTLHWNDDATALLPDGTWIELYEPGGSILDPIVNYYGIYVDPQGVILDGYGSDAYGEGWYRYPSEWLNIWFYDHPYDPDRHKRIHIEFDLHPLEVGAPMYIEFAVNWSTDLWSLEQPPQDSMPPLPGVDEENYIGREILLQGSDLEGHFNFDYIIEDYNPEWVSIDVRGYNFGIPGGFIAHECIGEGFVQSMDLSFVITGDPNCCGVFTNGYTGNIDCSPDGKRNLADITRLIDRVYVSKRVLCCEEEGNVEGDAEGKINLADITRLIDHVYVSKLPTALCQ